MADLSDKIKPEDLREGYKGWNPFQDLMVDAEDWNKRLEFENWKHFRSEFIPFDPNFNQIIDFYFQRYEPARECELCEGRGYSSRALAIESELSKRLGVGKESFGRLTQEERDILLKNGRPLGCPLGVDSFDMNILIKYHSEIEGIDYLCSNCQGGGSIVTGDEKLGLNLWMTHPRHGGSRGIYIATVQDDDLPEIYALLNDARDKLVARFKNIPKSAVKIDYEEGIPDISEIIQRGDY
jgi:hypothetical protein